MCVHALLSGLCNAVPEDALSLLTGHSVNNSALTPFYIAKDGALEVLMLMARFGPGLDHRGFSCNKHYIQGRHLLTSDIQSAHPEIWALISAQLLPGLDELLSGLKAKAVRSKDEIKQLRCAEFCFNLREAFLQDSAWHFFEPLYTPVFAGLSLYRNEDFVQWLTESFRPELVSLQTEADVVSKYICGFYPGSSSLLDRSLDALCIDRASTASESRRLLREMHKRMLQDKACMSRADSAADQQSQQQQQQQQPSVLPPQLTTSIYMPPLRAYSGVELLLKMYSAWHKGDPRLGIVPLRETHSAGCPYYRGVYYGGAQAAKSTQWAIANNKAMLILFDHAVQHRATLLKVRSSEKMDVAAKQVAQEWWAKIQQHPHMKGVPDMARCCKQAVSKHQGGVQTYLGTNSKKRDADGNEIVIPKVVHVMLAEAFCKYFDLKA